MEGYRETRAGAVECQEQQFSEAEAVMGRRSAMEAAASEGSALPLRFIGKAFAHTNVSWWWLSFTASEESTGPSW